ncbi:MULTISPECIES: glycoside hydrolase family 30 beta sandwich domain-containing protein [unclassified Lentimonas]|uniref:glycoside hydrolase family 30 protein n=1 Tax=unclassified Lentimonas TaxID=2630993 RepID=UPI001322FA69|nr:MULTISPECIES: glycoside hydrolase family 30 protein [unclassified Lentimonas]CAA6679359.1 Glycosyl hydrolase [Lentimonas sp. CC4]CAA6687362.1 Glycosyl hydrolase [Lentimonas sp. CC6]CAA7078034.1 Glycosyl hydrolase [Lentimonas sp. CC4]CAA7168004.1 Glycosyl hydrolase [Lentimonas sp. CC21]CAA7179579.1 Glycosyl hydrolase [Lentimonas sp. CC8]
MKSKLIYLTSLLAASVAHCASISVYTTAKDTELRLAQTAGGEFRPADQPTENEVHVFVDTDKQYERFFGIGGAITDASAEVFAKLPADKQQELLTAYFDEDEGIAYNLVRTSIHSCDFSSSSFTYIEEGDAELKTFSIEKDRELRIPFIKRAMAAIGEKGVFYASPWSPPPFMKGREDMLQGGQLLPEYRGAWANYFVKFIEAYEAEGIPVWGVTIQNEPMATQRWESCIYSAEDERDFLKDFLGPAFDEAGFGDKKIVVWDHNRDLINRRASVIFSDPEASKYAWGIGYHWYENWTGGLEMSSNISRVREDFPDKHVLFTEGCCEAFDPAKYQFWANAERYGRNMIKDFNRGTCGWTDWNILLDHTGGPNHVGNFCFAPVHADTRTGELIFTPTYYYIGHMSKFIKPGAQRMSTVSSRSALYSTSYQNPDGSMVSVVMNHTENEILYSLHVDEGEVDITIPARAIQTILYGDDRK